MLIFVAKEALLYNNWYTNVQICSFTSVRDIVFIQLVGNDLLNYTANIVTNNIIAFANYLHYGLHVKIIIIGELVPRYPGPRVDYNYNCRVIETNICLKEKLNADNPINHIILWRHRGFWQNFSHLGADGVHLNHQCMLKYYRSVRSSILHAFHLVISILIT